MTLDFAYVGNTNRNRYSLDKKDKDSWLDKILEKKKQKKLEEKKLEEKRQIKKEEQAELQEKLMEAAGSTKDQTQIAGSIVDLKA